MSIVSTYYSDQMLDKIASGREDCLFDRDMAANAAALAGGIKGKRALVLGGAGSIGAATIDALLGFDPRALHIVDLAENALAELARELRSRAGPMIAELRFLPLDFGGAAMERVLRDDPKYDLMFNFAAQKHVRGEKDLPSLLQMLETNVLKTSRLMDWLFKYGHSARCFSVSTDKAANPTSLMGASKRLMEHVLFSFASRFPSVTTARFANVAFSNGSLLQSFLIRVARRQPLAIPRDTRRYFISAKEAAQICLLAALAAPTSCIVFPRLDPTRHLRSLLDVAKGTLARLGFQAVCYDDPDAARTAAAAVVAGGPYPVLVTELDTSGEKPYEEFVSAGEVSTEIGMAELCGINYSGLPERNLDDIVRFLQRATGDASMAVTKAEIVLRLAEVIPSFGHIETGRVLDDRM